MPLSSLDIVFYYTYQASGPANNTLSLGGTVNANSIQDGVANNIFRDVTGDESAVGSTIYRAIGIKDTSSTCTMINPRVHITGFTRAGSGADTIYIAASTFSLNSNTMGWCTGTVETGAPTEIVTWIAEGAPSSTIFWVNGSPTTVGPSSGSTLNTGNWFGLWLRRIVPAGASAFSNRSVTIQVTCETTASPILHTVYRQYVIEI